MSTYQEFSETLLYQYISNLPPSLSADLFDEYFPTLSADIIDNGVMMRYFIRQANHRTGYITEVDVTTYNQFSLNALYTCVALPWKIRGALDDLVPSPYPNAPVRTYTGVKTANILSLELVEEELPGIRKKLNNITQFWIGE